MSCKDDHHDNKANQIIAYLYPLRSPCRARIPAILCAVLWILKRVTGRFWTSCRHTSQVLLPLIVNHFIAQSLWARASSPLQLHSIFNVSPPSHSSTKHIRQTASSSGMSSPSALLSSVYSRYSKMLDNNRTLRLNTENKKHTGQRAWRK